METGIMELGITELGITAKRESGITGKGNQLLATPNYSHSTYPNLT